MANLGFWNLIIIAAVAVVLRQCWKLEPEQEIWKNSEFLKHHFIQKIIQVFRYPVINITGQVIVILIVTRSIIYTGWLAYYLTQPKANFWDFEYFYLGSHVVFQNANPYQFDVFRNMGCQVLNKCYDIPFIHPPNFIPLIWPLALFPIEKASTIWVVVHLLTIGCLLWGANILLNSKSRAIKTACTIICLLIYGLVFDLRVGNISSIIAAFLVWSFILARYKYDIFSGILLGLSTVKPTISLLFLILFLIKRRWTIIGWCLAVVLVLSWLGIQLTGDSLTDGIQSWINSYSKWQSLLSNYPARSISRIDLEVIGFRLFPNHETFARLTSNLLALSTLFFVIQFLYNKQVASNWKKEIDLIEFSLIACLSSLLFYSQRQNTAILICVVALFLNYLTAELKHNQFSWQFISLWSVGMIAIFVQTGIIYHRLIEPLASDWVNGRVPYFTKVTIGTLPNYALLVLTIAAVILARRSPLSNSD